ncbi:MAG TPA: hypothetical protein VGH89_38570 [Pseudonocardia sp.]|jgi:hypothetical protein
MAQRLSGTMDLDRAGWDVPTVTSLERPELPLGRVELLHLMYEIRCGEMVDLVPFALQPSIPASATWIGLRCDHSPWGPFRMAMTRITARSGIRPRGLVTSAYVDNPDAARQLRDGWGYPTTVAEVGFRAAYEGIRVTVRRSGRERLDLRLIDPEVVAITPYISANLHVVDLPEGRRMLQVDPGVEFTEVQRGRPELRVFDPEAAAGTRIEPVYPVHAVYGVGQITLPALRWYFHPDRPLAEGTTDLTAHHGTPG